MEVSKWEQEFSYHVRARNPCLFVESLEEERAKESIANAALHLWVKFRENSIDSFYQLKIWSEVSYRIFGYRKLDQAAKTAQMEYFDHPIEEIPEFFGLLDEFADRSDDSTPEMLILADCGHLFGPESGEMAARTRKLRETLGLIRGTTRTLILLGKAFDLPAEVAREIVILPFELPTVEELKSNLDGLLAEARENYKDLEWFQESEEPFLRACSGLTLVESTSMVSLALAKHNAFDDRAVRMALREKAQIIRRANQSMLTYEDPTGSLEDVGGLEHVKAWIKGVDKRWKERERAVQYGASIPSGLFLVGAPGCGKTLVSRILAAHWQIPLLKFDVGAAFGSLLGQTESNIRQLAILSNACKPCIVFLDEIDKAFGGSPGEHDGGTGNRVKQTVLDWMQTKPDDVFLICTGNDPTRLEGNSEFLRSGRIDKTFFVDLPDLATRMEIFAIHTRKRGHPVVPRHFEQTAKAVRGFSGADCEAAVNNAVGLAFDAGKDHPDEEDYSRGAKMVNPLTRLMKESIGALRAWCKERADPAGATIDDEMSDTASYQDRRKKLMVDLRCEPNHKKGVAHG